MWERRRPAQYKKFKPLLFYVKKRKNTTMKIKYNNEYYKILSMSEEKNGFIFTLKPIQENYKQAEFKINQFISKVDLFKN